MTAAELALRRRIFAATGAPPPVAARLALAGLAGQHVVALSPDGEILMAHPFAAHRTGARVDADGRTWWGNCAWDALGIVAALGLPAARIVAGAVAFDVVDGSPRDQALFHVLVPARHWWDDITFT